MPKNMLIPGNMLVGGPSVAQSMQNAEAIRGSQNRNMLAEKQIASYDEDRETERENAKFTREATALNTAIKTKGTPDQQMEIYTSLGGSGKPSFQGENVTISYGEYDLSGPSDVVAEHFGVLTQSKNPAQLAKDPRFVAHGAHNGISMKKRKETDKKTKYTEDDALYNQLAKRYGATDLYGLDEDKAKKASEAAVRAKRYINEDMPRVKAIHKAFTEVESEFNTKEKISKLPPANRGWFDFSSNKDETKKQVKKLRSEKVSDEMIEAKLIDAGWDDKEVADIMGKKASKGKSLDKATALSFLKEAGGDKDKAREIAKEKGFIF